MKAKVNLQLLNTTTLDSGALGMLAMVIHQFYTPGHYRVNIMEEGLAVSSTEFVVDDQSDVMQLDIDLAQAVKKKNARPEECGCKTGKHRVQKVSPKGYVLFHASSKGGYSVVVSNNEDKVIFDSMKLDDGDLFAVSLLEPATYSMTNVLGSATGEIIVSLTPEAARNLKTLETRYIEVNQRVFDPECIELTSSQGLVFRIKNSSRIVIEKKHLPEQGVDRPVISWRQHLPAKKKLASDS
ncbi:MAG: hypothetical protein ACXWTL_06080 [Methylobacter sp.]